MAIQNLAGIWDDKAANLRTLGKNVNNYGRCWAAANAYEICAKELRSIFSIIETLQYDDQPPINN
jgi:hypothetical protein